MFSFSLLLILLFGEAINIALHNDIHNTYKVHGFEARSECFYFSCLAGLLECGIVCCLTRGAQH